MTPHYTDYLDNFNKVNVLTGRVSLMVVEVLQVGVQTQMVKTDLTRFCTNWSRNDILTFNDWYRSTDNGGSGVHTALDGEVRKGNSIASGYETGMALFNNGEVSRWGYGGHGQNGDAASNRGYVCKMWWYIFYEVYQASNTSTHTLKDTKLKEYTLLIGVVIITELILIVVMR